VQRSRRSVWWRCHIRFSSTPGGCGGSGRRQDGRAFVIIRPSPPGPGRARSFAAALRKAILDPPQSNVGWMFEVSLAAYLVVHLANFSVVLDLHIKCRMTDVRTAICPLLRNGSNYRRALPRAVCLSRAPRVHFKSDLVRASTGLFLSASAPCGAVRRTRVASRRCRRAGSGRQVSAAPRGARWPRAISPTPAGLIHRWTS